MHIHIDDLMTLVSMFGSSMGVHRLHNSQASQVMWYRNWKQNGSWHKKSRWSSPAEKDRFCEPFTILSKIVLGKSRSFRIVIQTFLLVFIFISSPKSHPGNCFDFSVININLRLAFFLEFLDRKYSVDIHCNYFLNKIHVMCDWHNEFETFERSPCGFKSVTFHRYAFQVDVRKDWGIILFESPSRIRPSPDSSSQNSRVELLPHFHKMENLTE
jgi:hypothetical protein